jgi:predicted dehydrogenase
VEDFGFLMMTMEDGLTATVTGGRIGWSHHPAAGTNQICLMGTAGAVLIDAYRPRLEIYDSAPPWTAPPVNPRDPMGFWRSTQAEVNTQPKRVFVPLEDSSGAKSDESHFLDCIIEGRESEMNARQAAVLTEILLAGYQSASSGNVVSLPLRRG